LLRISLPSLLLTLVFSVASLAQSSKPSLATPAISPDGKEIAFASGGDIWTVPADGGEARLLISNPADESRPLYSPDGTKLAFISTRTGAGDIYVLTLTTGALERLTFSDSPSNLDGWSRDGQWIYFTSNTTDVAGQGDILRVRSTGGTPLEVSHERYLNEFESAPSPDGKQVALVAKGISSQQWWRNGRAHIDETELWLKPLNSPSATDAGYRLLLSADAKHAWPMWSPDGKTLFYMSDKSGSENIWSADTATGAEHQLTHFTSGRCLWPTISYDGRTIIFERHFAIWKLDTRSSKSNEVPITLRGAPSAEGVTHTPLTHWRDLAISPDGNKLAVVDEGDVFATGTRSGGEAQRLTRTDAAESDPQWSPDSTKVVYRSERDGGSSLYLYDFGTQSERALTHGADIDAGQTWSPDGKSIAFIRNRKELHVLTIDGLKDLVIAHGELDNNTIAWSPDSHWVAYVPTGPDGFTNLFAVPAAGGAEPRPLTFLANGESATRIAWSPDGKYILFDTAQRSETPQIARVDLIPHVPSFREDQFTELFRKQSTPGAPDIPSEPGTTPEPAPSTRPTPDQPAQTTPDTEPQKPPAPETSERSTRRPPKKVEPTKIVFEGIENRLTLLPINLELRSPIISPDGKTLAFVANVADQINIYTYSLDELSREPASPRQLTSTPGSKSDIAWSSDSRTIYYLEGAGGMGGGNAGGDTPSSVHAVPLDTRVPRAIPVTASIEVDFDLQKQVVFEEAWNTLNHRFFRDDFNHHDWNALRAEWEPYIAGTRTGPELRRNINLLIGELNSSHSGINKPTPPAVRTGRLGLRFEREPFEDKGELIVREVVPLGPASLEGTIHPGDRLLAVDGTPVAANTNIDALLEDKVGKRVVLSVETAGKKRDAIVRPVTLQVEAGLLYNAWVEQRRAYVERISGGKLGYVHIAAMGDHDLSQLYIDLDVQNETKQGVVIDVRNNNGGYVNGRVIDVFARRNYLLMTPRDGATAPSRQSLGQRALGKPTVLVVNESTLSDGEDFTEGYRELGLGKVVGTPTAGWIIFTGAQRLIDGSSVRVPGYRIQTSKGDDMEMHPRPVDVEVLRPLGETETGEDAQLKKAVDTLLGQLK
jgi:Tol biopolymer transport system component/C-terminal processing protease CtpA/Prc